LGEAGENEMKEQEEKGLGEGLVGHCEKTV
jgi:hypothetical protein